MLSTRMRIKLLKNKKYVPTSLSKRDKERQIKSIEQGTERPKVKYRTKRSNHVVDFEKKYGYKITDPRVSKEIIRGEGIKLIYDKGIAAYFNAGSRPNVTPSQWKYARLASVILGRGARRTDKAIWDKYKI